jgi:hypothetical protein
MPVFAVTTAKDANWDRARGIRQQPYFAEHAAFADELVDQGVIILGGPVASDDDEDIALLAVEAPDEDSLRAIFGADPWTLHQVFRLKSVRAWTIWLDGRPRATRPAGDAAGADGSA